MKIKRALKIILVVVLSIIIAQLFILKPVDNSDYKTKAFYTKTISEIETAKISTLLAATDSLKAGWSSRSIVPFAPQRLIGGNIRGKYTEVNDSLFVRTIVFSSAGKYVAYIQFDLLIVTPQITAAVNKKLKAQNLLLKDIYFTASHTHSGYGGWSGGIVADFALGGNNPEIIEFLANKTFESIKLAIDNQQVIKTGFQKHKIMRLVRNRVDSKYPFDDFLRLLKIENKSGENALITTFQAHPTTIGRKSKALSGDYPGLLMAALKKQNISNFPICSAGAVASHGVFVQKGTVNIHNFIFNWMLPKTKLPYPKTMERAYAYSDSLLNHIKKINSGFECKAPSVIKFVTIPVYLNVPHFRIGKYLRLRETIFNFLFDELQAHIDILQIDSLLFISTPADFSGEFYSEIESFCKTKNLTPVITGFNGDYVGYITPDKYYHLNHNEFTTMNWIGPFGGAYFIEIIKKSIDKITD